MRIVPVGIAIPDLPIWAVNEQFALLALSDAAGRFCGFRLGLMSRSDAAVAAPPDCPSTVMRHHVLVLAHFEKFSFSVTLPYNYI